VGWDTGRLEGEFQEGGGKIRGNDWDREKNPKVVLSKSRGGELTGTCGHGSDGKETGPKGELQRGGRKPKRSPGKHQTSVPWLVGGTPGTGGRGESERVLVVGGISSKQAVTYDKKGKKRGRRVWGWQGKTTTYKSPLGKGKGRCR